MKKTVFFALLLVFSQAAAGEKILTIDFDIYKNDTIDLRVLSVSDGSQTVFVPEGDYKIVIKDKEGVVVYEKKMEINFLLYTDPPMEIDPSPIMLKMRYADAMKTVEIYNKEKLIFSHAIEICNNNRLCEKEYESHGSCPGDCSVEDDGVCTPDSDGVCDTDCAQGIDSDCLTTPTTEVQTTTTRKIVTTTTVEVTTTSVPEEITTTTEPKNEGGGIMSFVPFIVVLVIVVVLAVFGSKYYRKLQDAKIEKQRQDFLKWKEEQDKLGKKV